MYLNLEVWKEGVLLCLVHLWAARSRLEEDKKKLEAKGAPPRGRML